MRRHGQRQICFLVLLLTALVQFVLAGSRNNEKPLRVKLSVAGQENCSGDSSSVPVIRLKLRLGFTNLSDRKLIVARRIEDARYEYILAKNENALAAGVYEARLPHFDRAVTESESQEPPHKAPPAEFAILDPGKSFDGELTVHILVDHYDALSGNHVIQLNLATWPHVSPPEQFRDNWKKYGELVYEPVKSESVPFRVPPETHFTNCTS